MDLQLRRNTPVRITVIGSGYVGLVAAVCFAEIGHSVTCVDNVIDKVTELQAGRVPIYEERLPELLARHRGHRLIFSSDLAAAAPGGSSDDPANPIFANYGDNSLKVRLRAHPDVARRHHADLLAAEARSSG